MWYCEDFFSENSIFFYKAMIATPLWIIGLKRNDFIKKKSQSIRHPKLERVQKVACKVLLKHKYESYVQALGTLKLEKLETRRQKMSLTFGNKCIKKSKIFPYVPPKKWP